MTPTIQFALAEASAGLKAHFTLTEGLVPGVRPATGLRKAARLPASTAVRLSTSCGHPHRRRPHADSRFPSRGGL